MKKLLRILIVLIGLTVIVLGLKTIPLKKVGFDWLSKNIYVERNDGPFLQDWSVDSVLSQINQARESAGFSKIKINSKLNQSALSRLSVILSEGDYDGTLTGLTRELAIKNAGYEANLIGDLLLLDFFKTNKAIDYWKSDEITKGSLLHPDFREAGIAVKNSEDKVSVYVILVSPRKVIPAPKRIVWGGPELWEAINKRRIEMGVNPLIKRDELCTIASIRLNQLLELGKLDGHAGFVPVLNRSDLKWISDKYNISEFLAQGYSSPQETIGAWENTLGHKALLAGGEYVWGCVYAQNSYSVAIAAY